MHGSSQFNSRLSSRGWPSSPTRQSLLSEMTYTVWSDYGCAVQGAVDVGRACCTSVYGCDQQSSQLCNGRRHLARNSNLPADKTVLWAHGICESTETMNHRLHNHLVDTVQVEWKMWWTWGGKRRRKRGLSVWFWTIKISWPIINFSDCQICYRFRVFRFLDWIFLWYIHCTKFHDALRSNAVVDIIKILNYNWVNICVWLFIDEVIKRSTIFDVVNKTRIYFDNSPHNFLLTKLQLR